MQVAIFVARDYDEFAKYAKWFESKKCWLRKQLVCYQTSAAGEADGGGVNLGRSKHDQGSVAGSELECFECIVKPRDLEIICIQKPGTDDSVFDTAKNRLENMKEISCPVDDCVSSVCSLLFNLAKAFESKFDSVRIFIHWGGGNPLDLEEKFSNQLDSFLKTYHTEQGGCMMDVRAFAVSSRREDCLNVNKPVIELPESCEELEDLVHRFECSSQFAKAKDLMTKYVVEAMKQKMNIKSNGDGGENSPKDGDSLEYGDDLKSYFKLLQSQKIVGRNGIPMRKDWREWLDGVLDEKCNNPLCSLAYDDRGVALLSACLEEEV